LIHSLAVTEKREVFKGWTILLAITAFSLSLVGTFLVRSGVLTSVHAFAVDPTRGAFMLKYLAVVVGSSLLLYAWRGPRVSTSGQFNLLSREMFLLSNNVLLFVAMITVLLGTLYPLIIAALGLGKLSVGAPYFNTVFVPLVVPLFILMGIGPHVNWQSMTPEALWRRLRLALIISVISAVLLLFLFAGKFNWRALLGVSLAVWILVSTGQLVIERGRQRLTRATVGMVLAHVGIAFTIIGITLSSVYSVERQVRMVPGDTLTLGAYQFRFIGTRDVIGPNYHGLQGEFRVSKQGQAISTLTPEKRIYTVQTAPMTNAAIDAGIFRDLYVALGDPLPDQGFAVRIYYKPFVRWIWLGGLGVLLGGLCAMSDRRYRRKSESKSEKALLENEACQT